MLPLTVETFGIRDALSPAVSGMAGDVNGLEFVRWRLFVTLVEVELEALESVDWWRSCEGRGMELGLDGPFADAAAAWAVAEAVMLCVLRRFVSIVDSFWRPVCAVYAWIQRRKFRNDDITSDKDVYKRMVSNQAVVKMTRKAVCFRKEEWITHAGGGRAQCSRPKRGRVRCSLKGNASVVERQGPLSGIASVAAEGRQEGQG